MKRLVFFLFLFAAYTGNAQVLSLYPHPLQQTQNPFNEKFISRNKIKSIVAEISTKRDNDVIRSANRFIVFEYNIKGQLLAEKKFKMNSTDSLGISHDTLTMAYKYDTEGNLVRKIEYMGKGFVKKLFTYNTAGNLNQITTIKYDYSDPENGRVIAKDSIFTLTKKKWVLQRYFNDYKRPYQEIKIDYDSLGYLIHYRRFYLISKDQYFIDYKYNDHGLIREIVYSNGQNKNIKKEVYEYDEYGFLNAEFFYKNDELTERKEFLFKKDGSLKAILTKNIATNKITIWELDYRD